MKIVMGMEAGATGNPFERLPDRLALLGFRFNRLGRAEGANRLLELSPLPALKTAAWPYGEREVPLIATRRNYEATHLPASACPWRAHR